MKRVTIGKTVKMEIDTCPVVGSLFYEGKITLTDSIMRTDGSNVADTVSIIFPFRHLDEFRKKLDKIENVIKRMDSLGASKGVKRD